MYNDTLHEIIPEPRRTAAGTIFGNFLRTRYVMALDAVPFEENIMSMLLFRATQIGEMPQMTKVLLADLKTHLAISRSAHHPRWFQPDAVELTL